MLIQQYVCIYWLNLNKLQNIGVFHSKNINITNLTSRDSQMFHVQIYYSQNISLVSLNIVAPESSPNTDGIHIQGSSFVSIFNSNITTGDDCVSIGPGSNNLWIEEIKCGPGHGIRWYIHIYIHIIYISYIMHSHYSFMYINICMYIY